MNPHSQAALALEANHQQLGAKAGAGSIEGVAEASEQWPTAFAEQGLRVSKTYVVTPVLTLAGKDTPS